MFHRRGLVQGNVRHNGGRLGLLLHFLHYFHFDIAVCDVESFILIILDQYEINYLTEQSIE